MSGKVRDGPSGGWKGVDGPWRHRLLPVGRYFRAAKFEFDGIGLFLAMALFLAVELFLTMASFLAVELFLAIEFFWASDLFLAIAFFLPIVLFLAIALVLPIVLFLAIAYVQRHTLKFFWSFIFCRMRV